MPELPEVQTTVNGINKYLLGRKIISVWTNYRSDYFKGKKNIKDPSYFKKFKRFVVGRKISVAERKGKNIIIRFSRGGAILVHMKMTGHFLYGRYREENHKIQITNYKQNTNYKKTNKQIKWAPIDEEGPLTDPFNRHIRLVFRLDNGKSLALSDARKFAKVLYLEKDSDEAKELSGVAKDPFEMSKKEFVKALRQKKTGRIMNLLMDQELVSGIGNIYSDEILWKLGIDPEENISRIENKTLESIWKTARIILKTGMSLGGDSTSDYRNLIGERGGFQLKHKAYRRTGERCARKDCDGIIIRKIVGGRSSHFCDTHQKLKRVL